MQRVPVHDVPDMGSAAHVEGQGLRSLFAPSGLFPDFHSPFH